MPNKILKNLLKQYIETAFENEEAFLDKFWSQGGENVELNECYMASQRTIIHVTLYNGQHVTDTIDTDEFIAWCEAL